MAWGCPGPICCFSQVTHRASFYSEKCPSMIHVCTPGLITVTGRFPWVVFLSQMKGQAEMPQRDLCQAQPELRHSENWMSRFCFSPSMGALGDRHRRSTSGEGRPLGDARVGAKQGHPNLEAQHLLCGAAGTHTCLRPEGPPLVLQMETLRVQRPHTSGLLGCLTSVLGQAY